VKIARSLAALESGAVIALAVGAAIAVVLIVRNARAAARGAVNLAGNIGAGAIEGVGEQFGIPRTDENKCAAAKAAGDTWRASFDCPAGDFLKYVFSSSGSPPEPVEPLNNPYYGM